MTQSDDPSEPPAPESDLDLAARWRSGYVPDSDDDRPFPEVSEELVDREIRELIKAAHARLRDSNASSDPGATPTSPPPSPST